MKLTLRLPHILPFSSTLHPSILPDHPALSPFTLSPGALVPSYPRAARSALASYILPSSTDSFATCHATPGPNAMGVRGLRSIAIGMKERSQNMCSHIISIFLLFFPLPYFVSRPFIRFLKENILRARYFSFPFLQSRIDSKNSYTTCRIAWPLFQMEVNIKRKGGCACVCCLWYNMTRRKGGKRNRRRRSI